MSAYQQLSSLFQRLFHYEHLGAMAGWDQLTMMPTGGSDARAEAMAELEVLMHRTLTAPEVGEWLASADAESLDDAQRANLREMHRAWHDAVVLPERLVEARSLAGARCEQAWRRQRPDNDWAGFADNLREVVRLSREEATIRAEATGTSRYEALLNKFEPDMNVTELDRLFNDLRDGLPGLLAQVVERQRSSPAHTPEGPFDIEAQRRLGQETMRRLGFDFEHGRLDVSLHPFCGGVPEDVRLTTRYREDECLSSLMGIIHETGHARYEQNLPAPWRGQPLGRARSMSIHESQSLTFEMQLGRSEAFVRQLAPQLVAHFGNRPGFEVDNLVRLAQRVEPGLIRVDADEVSYPAHILLRYEIERALIEGEIEVDDIPALWDEKMQHYLGLETRGNYRDGPMQDIHWTDGSFGYFPTYSLGAMLAAQLMAAVRRDHPELDERLAAGEPGILFDWLKAQIWQQGSRFETPELIRRATGEPLDAGYYRRHLESRYLGEPAGRSGGVAKRAHQPIGSGNEDD
ncbi:carboxypeptidase M32 [Kushneria phosphatilytica]|uniref:Metal-dependent carboxypeptidase n=1 Tax=Kushneria phosphatilytica TaxID=657387 RepID=A0A5C0ZYW2_9GAMM|nr:carboxypeptidase M32 [Kushneria phosphatilytica]QEL09895.1 carboxypeptidase M32 [Kushneria phosphatilytica]